MADMDTKAASEKFGYTQATISKWCREGKIEGTAQDKHCSAWHIPVDAECPRKIKRVDNE